MSRLPSPARAAIAALLVFAPAAIAAPAHSLLAPAGELQKLSATCPPTASSPLQALLDETTVVLDERGRATCTYRLVYRFDSGERLEDWARSFIKWRPWYQDRPQLQAQVLTPDGVLHVLDAANIQESSDASEATDMFEDSRMLEAPLPSTGQGAIVEEVQVVRDTAVIVDAGRLMRMRIGRNVPVGLQRIVIDLPESAPFHYRIEKSDDVSVQRTRENGRLHVEFTLRHIPMVASNEGGEPSDVPRSPGIIVSTGESWEQVAQRYRALVEPRLAADPDHKAIAALAAAVRAEAGRTADRAALIEAAVRRLHVRVRYTGAELGQSAILPAHPSATLQRGYGDCKDKSLLLVELLRELGIPAELALLTAGPGGDTPADLPGWGYFNHAIVRVPGTPDTWVDATESFRRSGDLPGMDEGRWCLPISATTHDLVRIPVEPPTANRVTETREYVLSENGPCTITETSALAGAPEAEYRDYYGGLVANTLQEKMDTYARDAYLARGKVTATISDAKDFKKSFALVVRAEGARRGWVSQADAGVVLRRSGLFGRMPELFTSFDTDSFEMAGYSARRKAEVELWEPTVVEWRVRIVPPPGFAPDELPETLDLDLGPSHFHQDFRRESDGVVTGTLQFDPRRNRVSAAEVNQFRRDYLDLMQRPLLQVTFHHEGLALITQGELAAGLRKLRDESAAARGAAAVSSAHRRYSSGLLKAGLGEAAQREAKLAVDAEPTAATAWQALGEVLSHDDLGRLHGRGYDRAGAVTAFRKACELDTSSYQARAALGIALEFDANGDRYNTGKDLEEALALYRTVKPEQMSDLGLGGNLPALLEHMHRFGELEALARTLDNALVPLLTAVAAQRGPAAAIEEAQRSGGTDDARAQALFTTGYRLLSIRRYADAARLMQAGIRGRENASSLLAQTQMYARMKPYDPATDSRSDPRSALRRLFVTIASDNFTMGRLTALFSEHVRSMTDTVAGAATMAPMVRQFRKSFRAGGLPTATMLDIMMDQLDMRAEGDTSGAMRVRTSYPGGAPSYYFVDREKDGWKIVDFGADAGTGEMGYRVLAALDARDTVTARRWLQWKRDDPGAPADSTPFAFFTRALPALPPAYYRLAAASLLATTDSLQGVAALRVLHGMSAQPWSPEELQALVTLRAFAFRGRRDDSLLANARELRRLSPASVWAFEFEQTALARMNDLPGARACAAERLQRIPDDESALHKALWLAGTAGDMKSMLGYARRLEAIDKITASDYNNWAWFDILASTVGDSTLDRVHRGVRGEKESSASFLHTQAAVYAELGKPVEAQQLLLQSIEASNKDAPDSNDWYVLGRVAEDYGVIEAARELYRRVSTAPSDFGLPDDAGVLAQRRLRALEGGGKKK